MHAQIASWRFRPEDKAGLERDLAPAFAKLASQPGWIGGYWVDLTAESAAFVTLWASEAELEAGFRAIAADHARAADRLEPLGRQRGPARDLLNVGTAEG